MNTGNPSTTSRSPIKVLIVDDHATMREGLSAMIACQTDMMVIATASDGQEAIERYCQHLPDITLMDVCLPILSGIEAIRRIRAMQANARIIVVTTFDDDEVLFAASDADVEGFLLKDMLRKELLPAIRAVHCGQRYIPPIIAARLSKRSPKP